ncbi:MAG: NAD-glutamate dehydrogenase domain-containing protein, partial [Planctomycetota bacterium]
LCQHQEITKSLLQYYSLRFNPSLGLDLKSREQQAQEIYEDLQRALIEVRSSAQDQFLRKIIEVFRATLRTTRYLETDPALQAYKYQSGALPHGPQPRPWREIYVHHPEVEGIHLRGGPLARGGLRWSDRVTDFRTEVYGLQQTQMVKNVLIVPVGAKGGFVLRKPAGNRQDRREQADRVYRLFIKGLLKITDNVIDGKVEHPENIICWDGEDPYLVVAADKGTAHLSDTANSISEEHGFWLDDAFASGGKHGYDHKELAITARGAWEEAKIHFRRLGIREEVTPYSVVGIGDMSGDVFGNGMILAKKGKLLAAFNHLHIFIDPDPDLEASYAERCRLFNLQRSNWSDYNTDLISQGGGIFDRTLKTIHLPEISRELLELPADESFTPDQIIQAILKLPVDMVFNGGIGTYIRADEERDQDVGDPANSACRIPASTVRCRMLVEGGNLGVTPKGRIQISSQGTMLNTDFIDNSGGVDCSDHEVNLKTLLSQEVRTG